MNNEENIFDLSNVSDIPDGIKKELNVLKMDDFERKLIELFKIAKADLNLDQVQVGYYRKYNEHKERRTITAKLYNMCRGEHPAIESVEGRKGVYRLKDTYQD